MSEASRNSVTQWIASLRRGDDHAAQLLWDRYFERLVALAHRQLGFQPRTAADEEDVALSVFDTLVRGAANGRFSQMQDRRDLWCLLLAITKQKAVDLKRREGRQKRGGGRIRGESALRQGCDSDRPMTLDDLCGDSPTPEFLAVLDEEHKILMQLLRDNTLRKIAEAILEGYSTGEVAENLDLSVRTVQRKLILIRATWSRALVMD